MGALMKLELVPFEEKHFTDRYVSWLNDPEVVRLSEQRHKKHTMDSCREWMKTYRSGNLSKVWAIEVDGQHVGNVTALADERNGTVEVSNLIGERSMWGKGIGTLAVAHAIYQLFEANRKAAGLRNTPKGKPYLKIWIGTLDINYGELRIMEKLGMRKDCVIKDHFIVDGEPHSEVRKYFDHNDWRQFLVAFNQVNFDFQRKQGIPKEKWTFPYTKEDEASWVSDDRQHVSTYIIRHSVNAKKIGFLSELNLQLNLFLYRLKNRLKGLKNKHG